MGYSFRLCSRHALNDFNKNSDIVLTFLNWNFNHLQNPKSQITLIVIPVGQKTIKKSYADKRRHDNNICDALRVQHKILQRVDCVLHSCYLNEVNI